MKENKFQMCSLPILLLLIGGCQMESVWLSLRDQKPSESVSSGLIGPEPNARLGSRLSEMNYPAASPRGDDLDILVRRKWQVLELVNRTPHVYRGMQLWLNQEYIGEVDRIDIRSGNILPLKNLVNLHGESYPVGGLFNPDKTFPVLLAELYDPRKDMRYRLLVVDS